MKNNVRFRSARSLKSNKTSTREKFHRNNLRARVSDVNNDATPKIKANLHGRSMGGPFSSSRPRSSNFIKFTAEFMARLFERNVPFLAG